MPSTPISCRASLTSSSLEVRIIASILVINIPFSSEGRQEHLPSGRDLPVVSFLSVLRKIKTLDLVVFGNAQADHYVNNLQNRQRDNNRQDPGNGHARELVQQLVRIALDQAGRQYPALSVLKDRVDGTG